MLIRPMMVENNNVRETVFKSNTYKNDLYVCPVDAGHDPYGDIIYDVVLISEIIGDMPGSDTYDFRDTRNLGKMFGKIVHYFTGRISAKNASEPNPNKRLASMTLIPIVSYITSFNDVYPQNVGLVQFCKYDNKVYTNMMYNAGYKDSLRFKEAVENMEERSKYLIELDIPSPLYPALRLNNIHDSQPTVFKSDKWIYSMSELINNLSELEVHNVFVDFEAEAKMNVERTRTIRALLGTPVDEIDGAEDPLVNRIVLGNIARNIAVDFMKVDTCGMMESCTLIFDNKVVQQSGLLCGFKSIVSPFGEIYPAFNDFKASYMVSEFDKICKVNIGTSNPKHYRVTVNCNQYEITVKASILDNNKIIHNRYDFKNSLTIKMKKSEAITDYVTIHFHKQQQLKEYYNA